MSAIITDDFRRNQARLLVEDITTNDGYAIGIGKSDPWKNDSNGKTETQEGFIIPTSYGTVFESKDIINNLMALQTVEKTTQVITKNSWVSGRSYKTYDQNDSSCFYASGSDYPCVVTHDNQIYICLSNYSKNGQGEVSGLSTSSPNSISTFDTTFNTSDGYVWAHVQDINIGGTNSNFITPQFVPIEVPSSQDILDATSNQGGLFYGVSIINGGSGYISPDIIITFYDSAGNEAGAETLGYNISNGTITKVYPMGGGDSSYDYWNATASWIKGDIASASINISGAGSGFNAIPLIAPLVGFGGTPLTVTPSWFVGISAKFVETGSDQIPIIKFRQISLLRNFTETSTDETITTLKYITLSGTIGTALISSLESGDILQDSNGAKFYYDYYDSVNSKLYYHQNSNLEVNFQEPTGAITFISSGDIASNSTPGLSEYEKSDGDVLFHENRKPFSRSTSQTEEINMIIQL